MLEIRLIRFLKVDCKINFTVYHLLLISWQNQGLPCSWKERTFPGHTVPYVRTAAGASDKDDDCGDPNLGGVKHWNWIHKFTFQKCRSTLPLAANCRKPELTLSISIISPRMGNPPQRGRQIDIAGPSASAHLVMDASEENWGSRHICVLPTENKHSLAIQHLP